MDYKTLRMMTQRVSEIVYPSPACWEASLMLRDALTCAGIPARLAVVSCHGSDAHCAVVCGEYVCDPTVFQFNTGDEWTVVPLAGSPYTLGGNEEFTANIRELENADGLRMHADSVGLSEDEVSGARMKLAAGR
jgi:hypothetical protein